MALSENSVPSKACCIRGYDPRYVSEVCFGGMFRGMFRTPYGIYGYDSWYDSRV